MFRVEKKEMKLGWKQVLYKHHRDMYCSDYKDR